MELPHNLQDLIELFSFLDERQKLEELIKLGELIEELPESERTQETLIPGCISQVHVLAQRAGDIVAYAGSADALIIKGYLKILFDTFDGKSARTIRDADEMIKEFIIRSGIDASLVPSRSNAFERIYRAMQTRANA